MAVLQTKRGD